MEQIAAPDKTVHASASTQPLLHKLLDAKQDHQGLVDDTLSSTSQSSNMKTELMRSSSFSKSLTLHLPKRSPGPGPESPLSHVSHPNFSDPIPSNSSTFCTSLFSSSLASPEPRRRIGTLPFLPHPPKCEQQVSAGQSLGSSVLLSSDIGNSLDEAEHSDDLNGLLNLSGDGSDGSYHGENNALHFAEHMEFQFLSEQLGIAITDNEESPRLDVSFVQFVPHNPPYSRTSLQLFLVVICFCCDVLRTYTAHYHNFHHFQCHLAPTRVYRIQDHRLKFSLAHPGHLLGLQLLTRQE
jgi:hypothetical protein